MNKALWQQTLASLPVLINVAVTCCTASWLPNAIYFMRQPNHQPSATLAQCNMLESTFQVGRLLLAIPGGILADKYGRKYITISIGCIQVVTCVLMSLTHSINVLFAIRFFQGFSSALLNAVGSNFIGEISSPKYRGLFVVMNKIFATVGMLVECFLASVLNSYWIMVYVTTALTLLFFPSIPWILESPYHLVNLSKYEEAKQCLQKLRAGHSEREISDEYKLMKESVEYEKIIKSEHTWIEFIKLRSTRRPLICALFLNTLVLANGNAVMFLYASVIFPPNEYFSSSAYPLIMCLIQLISTMGAVFVIDAFPRRYLYMFCGFLSFIIQSFSGIAHYEYSIADEDQERNVWKWTFLMGSTMYWVLANMVMLPLNLTLRTEIFPISIRGLGNSLSLICQTTSVVIHYQLFIMMEKHFGVSSNYAIFAFNSLLLVIAVYFLVPETRGKTLAEVQQDNYGIKGDKKMKIDSGCTRM